MVIRLSFLRLWRQLRICRLRPSFGLPKNTDHIYKDCSVTTLSRLSVLRAAAQDAFADNCGSSLPVIMKDEIFR